MEHARKMILIPRESVDQLVQSKTVQTPGTSLSRLHAEMSEILNSSQSKTDREKWKRYHQVLQRFLNLKEVKDEAGKIRKKKTERMDLEDGFASTGKSSKESGEFVEEKSGEFDINILENIPATFRKNGIKLLQSLKSDGRVTWGPTGAVSIDGSAVRGSNIIDLISFAMRSKKEEAPRGLRQFAHTLHTASIPKEFIKNN